MKIKLPWAALSAASCILVSACGGSGGSDPAASASADSAAVDTAAADSVPVDSAVEAERLRLKRLADEAAASGSTGTTTSTGSTSTAGSTAGGTTSGSTTTTTTSTGSTGTTSTGLVTTTTTAPAAMTYFDAWRLADQATFGPTEALITTIKSQGAEAWIKAQFGLKNSAYSSGGGGQVHQYTASGNYCDGKGDYCWRDNYSSIPLVWDFYRNAVNQPDQLRQRVALALQQILVISGLQIDGTYGFRNYQNAFLNNAFASYSDVLKSVMLSPVMGDYLNGVNNDKAAPNENFARELLQLFSLGNCMLNADGTQAGGKCVPVYDNTTVRNYAYALTGWTYPAGGATPWGCWPTGANCRYYGGDMVPAAATLHDTTQRTLLAGVSVPAGQSASGSMNYVLSSLMAHGNMAPFISKQLIQHLVSSNPSAAYVQRVSSAFTSGRYTGATQSFGSGNKGDMQATVAAILLDPEARGTVSNPNSGKLREPVLMFAGALRILYGNTDGDALSWWWGDTMRQHIFRPPSVFNFYPPDFPVAGTNLMGPAFALHGASTALQRLNYLTYLVDWGGSAPDANVPNAVGTKVDLTKFASSAADSGALVDRLSLLAIGHQLNMTVRSKVIAAVDAASRTDATSRTRAAAYLVLATPDWQVSP